MKRLKDKSDVPKAGLGNFAKSTHKLKQKDMAAFHSPAEEWVLPDASTKEPEERVNGRFWSEHAHGQQARP